MSLRLVTPPTALAVSLAEAKAHLRVTDTAEDALITAMITSATETAEQITGRAIMPQTWELTLDGFDEGVVLTRVPVSAVTSLTYIDAAGATQTSTTHRLRNADDFSVSVVLPGYGESFPETLDDTETVKVRFTAGYANAAAVPEPIKAWIKLTVSAMYENREAEAYSSRAVSTTVKMSFVDGLLDRYRVWS